MAVLGIETIAMLQLGVSALRAAGFADDQPALATLLDKIERNRGNERAWLAKLEEIPAILNAKIRRVRSTADAERGYDHDKLHSELTGIIVMLQAIAAIKPEAYVAPVSSAAVVPPPVDKTPVPPEKDEKPEVESAPVESAPVVAAHKVKKAA